MNGEGERQIRQCRFLLAKLEEVKPPAVVDSFAKEIKKAAEILESVLERAEMDYLIA